MHGKQRKLDGKKAGIFSPISLEAVEIIGQHLPKVPNLMMAYLILARHAGQSDDSGFGTNRLIGAGATKVASVLKMQWKRAKILIEKLEELQVIEVAPKGLFVGTFAARYLLKHEGSIQIPHALLDGLGEEGDEDYVPGISRLLDKTGDQSREVVFTAMLALVHCYRRHDMNRYGGVDCQALHQQWSVHSVRPVGRGYKIRAKRLAGTGRVASPAFFADVMKSLGAKGTADLAQWMPVFNSAMEYLGESGLIYESVTLLNRQNSPVFPLRINDFHAIRSNSELSYIEHFSGAGFYTHATNSAGEEEGIWFYLPVDPIKIEYSIRGLVRLRFRCACPATATGLSRDKENLEKLRSLLIQCDLIDDL